MERFCITFDAAMLLHEHPPKMKHPYKALLFEKAYPTKSIPNSESFNIEVTQWRPLTDCNKSQTISLSNKVNIDIQPNFFDYLPVKSEEYTSSRLIEWHVNFADKRLFFAYGSHLFAQDEMQVVEHPLLACVREAFLAKGLRPITFDGSGPMPILIKNIERRLNFHTNPTPEAPRGLYGNYFSNASVESIINAAETLTPSTFSNIIAMSAISVDFGIAKPLYNESEIELTFLTAYMSFSAAKNESSDAVTVIHTGFWGCGAFGGHRKLMIAIQVLAARAAAIHLLVFHSGDDSSIEIVKQGINMADIVYERCGSPCQLDRIVNDLLSFGCRWGVSDGT